MIIKFSEMCAARTDLASRVEAAFDNFRGVIAQGFGAFLAPALEEGETVPDVGFQLELLRRRVQQHRERVEGLDEEVLEEIHGDEKVRAELNLGAAALDAKLRHVRSAYRGVYGLRNLARVGLKGSFPRGAVRLHRYAVVVKTSLESPDLVLEPLLELDLAAPEGESTNFSVQLAGQLDPELSRLGELLDERHHERGKTSDVRLRRQVVLRDFDGNVRGVIRMAQGMFRLAGRNDLAVRIRPLFRRVLRKLDEQESPAAGETDSAPGDVAGPANDANTGGEPVTDVAPVDSGDTPSSEAPIG